MESNKYHWDTIYSTKSANEVSWTQEKPTTSLYLINELQVPKCAAIIDIGGGDSKLVDYLLEDGYTNITVLDISEAAINKAKARLGEKASLVSWIVSDIRNFTPTTKYDIWHDRAAFHFLTNDTEINQYKTMVSSYAQHLIIATFSENGPLKCSGLEIKQYSINSLENLFSNEFQNFKSFNINHTTPFNTTQNFTFCIFKNLNKIK